MAALQPAPPNFPISLETGQCEAPLDIQAFLLATGRIRVSERHTRKSQVREARSTEPLPSRI